MNIGDMVRWKKLMWFVTGIADSLHDGTDYNKLVTLTSFSGHNTIVYLTDTATDGYNINDATPVRSHRS